MEMNFFFSFFFNQGIKQYQFVVNIYIYIFAKIVIPLKGIRLLFLFVGNLACI